MWPDVLEALPPLWIIVGAFLVAGTVKGIAGVGLPLTALGILTFQTDPRSAIALALVPIFLSNLWQFLRAGAVVAAIRRYWPLILMTVIVIPTTIILTSGMQERLLFGVLGVTFLLFVAINLTRWAPRISDRVDFPAQLIFGCIAGVMGGLTSLWLPVIVVYLSARDVAKEEFVRAVGLILFAGSIPLFAGYLFQGYTSGPLAIVSLGLVVPTLAGMAVGERLRRRLSEEAFRRVLLFVFILIGLNLIRRALVA